MQNSDNKIQITPILYPSLPISAEAEAASIIGKDVMDRLH